MGEGEFGVVSEVKEFRITDPCHCSVCLREKAESPPVKKVVITEIPPNATHRDRKQSHGSRVSFADVPVTIEDMEFLQEPETQKETMEYSSSDDSGSDNIPNDFALREELGFMRAHCTRGGLARYAVKCIRQDIPDEMKEDAAIDLASEAKFLASLSHPNIVKLRAVVGVPGHEDFHMVMDRLYSTLNQKIVEWRKTEKTYKGFLCYFGRRQEDLDHVRIDRMVALYDISRALRYLHSKK